MTHVGIYSKIMTQPIQLQATVSEDCLDLIKSMLEGKNSKMINLVENDRSVCFKLPSNMLN